MSRPTRPQCGGQAFTFAVANLGECAIPLARGDIVFAAGTIEIDTSTGRVTGAGNFEGVTQLSTQSDGGTGIMVISGVNVTVPAAPASTSSAATRSAFEVVFAYWKRPVSVTMAM